MFHPRGLAATQLARLGWVYTVIACAVVVAVCIVLLIAIFRPRPQVSSGMQDVTVSDERTSLGVRWIVLGGVVIPAIILTAAFLYAIVIQAAVAHPPTVPVAMIEVIGHRWWWEVRYVNAVSHDTIVTANEIHVPVGQAVQLHLASEDVIHSFWIPELAGKTDLIPGQTNTMWLRADRPGSYRGQCAEYCGLQHAHMAVIVDADPPMQYRQWIARQRNDAIPPSDTIAIRGRVIFQSASCSSCHSIRGFTTLGHVGPDLTHLTSRRTIAAGLLPNTPGNLAGWMTNAQGLKPGSGMPTMFLSARDVGPLLAYLETLK